MKKLLFTLALACLAVATAQAAPYSYSKSTQGWYIASNIGIGLISDPDVSANNGLLPGSGEADTDPGFGITFGGGYEYNNMRFELEYSHRVNDGSITNATGILTNGTDAEYSFNSFMFNFLYDFYLTDAVYWYNGLGLGFSRVKFETNRGDDTATVLAWQLMTGIGYDLTENVALTFGYRLFTTRDPDFNIGGWNYDAETPFVNTLELGVRYNF